MNSLDYAKPALPVVVGSGGEEELVRRTITACAFWLVENYALQGRLRQAEELFQHVLGFANDPHRVSGFHCGHRRQR